MNPVRRLDEQFFAAYDDILKWAVLNGVSNCSRFHAYRKTIERLRAYHNEMELVSVHSRLKNDGKLTEMLSTMAESIELVEVITALRKHDIDIPHALLDIAFSGSKDAFQEDQKSNSARNAMFELSMGAAAARQGFKPILSSGNPDVSFELDHHCVKIECKRVMSKKRVVQRLEEGSKQLEKTVKNRDQDVGVVAISVSKIFNPGDKILTSDSPHDALSQQINNMLKENEQVLIKTCRPCVDGFLFLLSSPVYVSGMGYTKLSAGTLFPLNMEKKDFLRRLSENILV